MATYSVRKYGSLRLLLLALVLLLVPMIVLTGLLSTALNRARELAALTPEGKHDRLA